MVGVRERGGGGVEASHVGCYLCKAAWALRLPGLWLASGQVGGLLTSGLPGIQKSGPVEPW